MFGADSAKKFLCVLYGTTVYGPLRDLYLRGPAVGGYGFWMGKADVDICAELTQVKSSFWQDQKKECDALIDHHVDAFVLGVVWTAVLLISYRVASGLWFRIFVVDPFLRRLDRIEQGVFRHQQHYEEGTTPTSSPPDTSDAAAVLKVLKVQKKTKKEKKKVPVEGVMEKMASIECHNVEEGEL